MILVESVHIPVLMMNPHNTGTRSHDLVPKATRSSPAQAKGICLGNEDGEGLSDRDLGTLKLFPGRQETA